MHPLFTSEQWNELDDLIVKRRLLLAIKCIRRYAGVGIKDAIDIHFDRYKQLRALRPGDFTCTDDEYWRDVYS